MGSSEYVVVEGPCVTFEALRAVLDQRCLTVVEEDQGHLRLAFRFSDPHSSVRTRALCHVFDVGHGLAKLEVACIDERDGRLVAPDPSLTGLFMQLEHSLHAASGEQGRCVLPPLQPIGGWDGIAPSRPGLQYWAGKAHAASALRPGS